MIHEIYSFVTGPAAWASVIIFAAAFTYKLFKIIKLTLKSDPQILKVMSLRLSLISLVRWIVPFSTTSSRQNPFITLVNFTFHTLLFITPLFLTGHVIMIELAFGIKWFTFPEMVTDYMTVIFILCCLFLAGRRLVKAEVRFVTTMSDWLIIVLAATPFVTGYLAYNQYFNYQIMMILHVISGEVLLIAIPLTRLSHMFYAVFIRAHTASEFGNVRYARDW